MRRLVEGTMDIALMYTPTHAPGLIVEHLFDEVLVQLSSEKDARLSGGDYIHVDWGPGFFAKHREYFPDLERPARVVNIGWLAVQLMLASGGTCFLPRRMARPLIAEGRLFCVAGGPEFTLPAYMVFPRETDSDVLRDALQGLRALATEEAADAASEPVLRPE